jgi:CRP/FNR family transcriptional regulator, anaerobic regulatory protein
MTTPTPLDSLLFLKEKLQMRTAITDDDLAMVFGLTTFKQFEKGEIVTAIGRTEQYLYFIIEGVTRSYFYKEDKDVSLDFHFTGDFVSVYESFLDRVASEHGIEALAPLSTVRISYDDLQKLYAQSPKFEQVGRILTEEQFKKSSERVKDLLSLSATERYLKLLNAHPNYVQNIPLKYLASYLNITPESLSRIRKSI